MLNQKDFESKEKGDVEFFITILIISPLILSGFFMF